MKKIFISGLTALLTLISLGFVACGNQSGENDSADQPKAHTVHEWTLVSSSEATCGEAGRNYYSCSCGAAKSVRTQAASGGHDFGGGNVCSVCGYIDMSGLNEDEAIQTYGFYFVDSDDSSTYTQGDAVCFGSYPQDLIVDGDGYAALEEAAADGTALQGVRVDEEVYSELKSQEGVLPAQGSSGDWTSYGYYDGGQTSDYMFYKDVTVGGKKYRGVYLLKYRAYYSGLAAQAEYSYIDEQGFALGTAYWFEYAPVLWNVLDYQNGNLLLNSEYCLEGQPYQAVYEGGPTDVVITGTDTYINDWEASTLRAFLNGSFYDTAFSAKEKSLIETVTLDNANTGYQADAKFQTCQNSTQDKVFLLSYQDVLNTDYGFTEKASYDSETTGDKINSVPEAMTRRRSYTAYSTIQGLRTSSQGYTANGDMSCWYLLRSAGSARYSVAGVNKYGSAVYTGAMSATGTTSNDGLAYNGDLGVLPSLYIKVGK